jgi:CubicO group peptidase (beta-lactamase class C family)
MSFYQLDVEAAPREVGMREEPLNHLTGLFRDAVASGNLFWGAQLALYRRGKRVLDIGGGLARASDQKPVTPETMFVLYSSTKGLAALAMHMLHDRGLFHYDDPVCRYWPEFARNGKEQATVAQMLGHRIGITVGPEWLTYKLWGDRQKCAQAMEELTPRWTPGEANGYHPLNYGFMINEFLQRVDGRDCGRFLREEVFAPLGVSNVFLGLPASEEPRVACVYESPADDASLAQMAQMMGFTPDADYLAFQRSLNFEEKDDNQTAPFPEWTNIFNRPEVHRVVLPGGGGIASARDMANIYSMISLGATWEGKRYLTSETLERSIVPTNKKGDIDRSLRIPIIYGLGWMLGHIAPGATLRTFGHPGKGGQICLADLDRGLSLSFLNTGQKDYAGFFKFSTDLVALALEACQ